MSRKWRDHRTTAVLREYRTRYGAFSNLLTQDMRNIILKALVLDIALCQMNEGQPLSNTLDLYREVVEAATQARILHD